MDNNSIAKSFSLLSKLMEIHGENSFKSKTYSIAAYKIEQLTVELQTLSSEKIFAINGIGDGLGRKIIEIIETEKLELLEEIISKTPEGILEMMKIKGLGSKKISVIWKEMDIENVGQLLYACHENRLEMMKGFGKKTQQNVIEAIEFFQKSQGNYLYAQVEELAQQLVNSFTKIFNTQHVSIAGDFARHTETVHELIFAIALPEKLIREKISSLPEFEFLEKRNGELLFAYNNGIKLRLIECDKKTLTNNVFEKTGSAEFIQAFHQHTNHLQLKIEDAIDDKDIFKKAGMQFIPAFLREEGEIISIAARNEIPVVIEPGDIRGIIHCHSNWSDGSNTLEELATSCITKGFEYLAISDHSKSAYYAQGLSEEKIKAQHDLVDELNERLAPFRIFKSIESDILNDGNLDYSDKILSTFDLVIASVHSNLKMNEEKAMRRLLQAIENPYTTILGHMTGRLLLSRNGFSVDHEKIIDACAANNVVIEMNAHPRRLDMRWQWIPYALSKNVLLSIDPDAHSIPEFDNTRYGVLAAQKGMATPANNLSSFTLKEFENFLMKRKYTAT